MITVQEAYRTLTSELRGMSALSCHEYDSRYVFNAVPTRYADDKDADRRFDTLYSVDKKTGEIKRFTPMDIPLGEYKRGKRITIFDRR